MKNILILCTFILFIFSCAKKQVERKSMHVPEPDNSDITFKSDNDDKAEVTKEIPEIIINKTPAEAFKNSSKQVLKNTSKKAVKKTSKEVVRNTPKKTVKNASKEVVKNTTKKVLKKTPIDLKKKVNIDTSGLIYTVQIAASTTKDKKYSKIDNIITYKENSLTKYSLGSFKTFAKARKYRSQIIKKYKGAFVKGLRNNVPVPIR